MTQQHSGSGDISRSLAIMWAFDLGRSTRGPKPKLSVDAIVDVAVDLADTEGLDAVSMRRIGQELGVGTMSLYRHVPGKEELLDLMLERVNAPSSDETLGDDWRTSMQTLGRGLWTLYTTHPWLPLVDQTRPLLGPNALRGLDIALETLKSTGLSGQQQIAVIGAIDAFVMNAARQHNGAALAEQATGVSNEEFWTAQEPVLTKAMASGDYPHVAALDMDAYAMAGEDFMEFGLTLLLDGIANLIRR
ncbi:TetR/AcrR family transcriptional regulator [Knoellia subterranea]|uniref:TetR/AcrR family transcriptional regulator n=1 Tax=Knoellia subterranea TaxID=184882 RepID=UPI00055C2022|nr:TetR/AcrR family transcriptional regulator [Knoellia subterranea]